MRDEYVMDRETGELIPATEAIRIFYTVERHDIRDAWTDKYTPTGLDVPGSRLEAPNFAGAVRGCRG